MTLEFQFIIELIQSVSHDNVHRHRISCHFKVLRIYQSSTAFGRLDECILFDQIYVDMRLASRYQTFYVYAFQLFVFRL